jgi:arginine/lysine/ornithine decarboxylase
MKYWESIAENLSKAGWSLGWMGKVYTVRYDAVNAMLLNEFLKEHRENQEQAATITQLKRELQATATRQQKQIEALTAGLQKVSAQLELSKLAPQVAEKNP